MLRVQNLNKHNIKLNKLLQQSGTYHRSKVAEEKAKMILEALRNKESQYFQQLRKKATKKQDSGKPDW